MEELIQGNLLLLISSFGLASIFACLAMMGVWLFISSSRVSRQPWEKVFLCGPFVTVVLAFVLYSANIPYDDDFNSIVAYAARPWPERLRHLLDYNWEHRVGLTNLCTEIMLDITGRVNFQWLEVIGLSFAAGLGCFFWKKMKKYGVIGYFAGASFVWLLTAVISDYFFWPMASIQNNGVLLLACLSIIMVKPSEGKWRHLRFPLALLFAVAATFTSGSGMIVWPIMSLMMFMRTDCHRTIFEWVIFLLIAVGAIAFYFHEPWISQNGSKGEFSIFHSLAYFLTFAGAWTCIPGVALCAGIVVCSMLGIFVYRVNRLKHPEMLFFALYIVAVMAAGSLLRSSRVINALPPRHPELPFALLGCLVVLVFDQWNIPDKRKRIGVTALCGYAVFVNLFSFSFLGSIWHDRLEINRRNLLIRPVTSETLTAINGPWHTAAITNLCVLEERGIYSSLWTLKEGEVPPAIRIDPGDYWTPGRRQNMTEQNNK